MHGFSRYPLMVLISVAGLLACRAEAATLIVHPAVGIDSIAADEIEKVFRGKKKNWANGTKVVLVVHQGEDDFLKSLSGKSASQFGRYWKKMVFTGKGSMPEFLDSDDEVRAFVAGNEGAVGFVSGEAGDGVQAVAVE